MIYVYLPAWSRRWESSEQAQDHLPARIGMGSTYPRQAMKA